MSDILKSIVAEAMRNAGPAEKNAMPVQDKLKVIWAFDVLGRLL